jgi:acyl transferase domain-containing protein
MVLDTACSSSLVAIHQACNSILNGESEYAIAGGVELHITPDYFINFCQAKVVSKRGIPAVFDEKADGMVLGEGAGVVLLKDYEKALADGDRIYGVIIGSAINNDGHTMGITVPSQEGQKDVIRRAIDISGISPETITYLEAHGTGTLLGDPIEIRSTEQVYKEYTDKHQFCGVGSVKSNMGHLLRASGIASFIKVLLSLNYKMIPATLHIDNPHPRFKFEQSPFYPVRHTQEWNPDADIRRAGISSFGFGGTNCHIIIEEMKGQKFIKRYPLPKIKFNKKQFDIAKKIEEYSFLSKLFDDLEKGYIHTDDAIAQLEKNNFMT